MIPKFPDGRLSSTHKIHHLSPKDFKLNYILAPIGLKYNDDLELARKGDIMAFLDNKKVEIDGVYHLDMSRPYCDAICRIRYGIDIDIALSIWIDTSIIYGGKEKDINKDKCLMITYKEITDGKKTNTSNNTIEK